MFLNLMTGVLTARMLGPEGRGELAAITTWPQFMAFVMTLGLPAAVTFLMKSQPGEARSLYWAVLPLATLLGVAAAVAGWFLLPLWLIAYSPAIVRTAQWAMLLAPVALLNITLISVLQAREEFTLFNLTRLSHPFCSLLLLSLAAVSGSLTSITASAATLLALLPSFSVQIFRLSRTYAFTLARYGSATRSLLSYGIRSYGIGLVGALGGQLDRALLVGLVSPEMLGTYVVAANASLAVAAFPTALGLVLLPKASGREAGDVMEMTSRSARVSLLVSIPAALVLAAAGPFVIGVVYGPGFEGAVPVFRILLFEAVFRGLVLVLSQALMALNRPGLATIVDGTGLTVLFASLAVFVPAFGLNGAGASLIASALARLFLVMVFLRMVIGTRLPAILPGPAEVRAILQRLAGRRSS